MSRALAFSFVVSSLLLASVTRAADPACDDFERASLGPAWTTITSITVDIVNGSDLGSTDSGGAGARWTADVFGADQFSHAVISDDKPAEILTQVSVRYRASDRARYGFHWNGDPGRSEWEIKYDGVPSAQTRILASAAGAGPEPGDSICIEVEGATIRGYHEGRLVLSATDTAPDRISLNGPPGVVARTAIGSVVTPPVAIFESWMGGTLAGSTGCAGGGEPLLMASREGEDVLLTWTLGAAPFLVERAAAAPVGFAPIASCQPGPAWTDPGVAWDRGLLFYRVDE